jgi:4-amino-4-deoxy-L-arabinose transferase-like glycosyltransferase
MFPLSCILAGPFYTQELPPRSPNPVWTVTALAALCLVFFVFGFAMIPHVGIQSDEALFSSVLFDGPAPWFWIQAFKKKIPLMLMTYLGTLKSGIYAVVFSFWPPSVYSLRVPALILGALSIPLFFRFADRATDRPTAWFAAALLAVDPAYLLASTMDWGPVVIQHLTLLTGLLLVLRSVQTGGRLGPLAGAGLALGLGLWDKALFLWMLSGAALATLAVFPHELKRFLSLRRLTVFGCFFLIGALPLIIYNIRRPMETFQGNTQFSTEDLASKVQLLPYTANGAIFFGFFVEEDWAVRQRTSDSEVEQTSVALSQRLGERRESLNWKALALSLLLSPILLFTRFRRITLFLLIMLAVAWGQMLATKGAGGGAHHTILLWPYPLLLIAVAFRWLTEKLGPRTAKWGYPALAMVLCLSSVLVLNHYLAQVVRNGATGSFSSAFLNLSDRLKAYSPERIYLTDWGFLDNLYMLHRGKLPLYWGSEPLQAPEQTPEVLEQIRLMLADKDALFIAYTDDKQVFAEVNPKLREAADKLGFERETVEVIYDFNGRPTIELFRFRKAESALSATPGR